MLKWVGENWPSQEQFQTSFIVTLLDLKAHFSVPKCPFYPSFLSFPIGKYNSKLPDKHVFWIYISGLKTVLKKRRQWSCSTSIFLRLIIQIPFFILKIQTSFLQMPESPKYYGFERIIVIGCLFGVYFKVFLLQQIQEGKIVWILKYFPKIGKQLNAQMWRTYTAHKRLLQVSYCTVKDKREICFSQYTKHLQTELWFLLAKDQAHC